MNTTEQIAVAGPVERGVRQHTPGPWECSARPSGPWWHIGAGNQSICTVHACSKKHTPVYAAMFKANADLIAAAPELLLALREIADDYADRFDMDSPSTNPGMKYVVKQARAAIEKATGCAA